MNYRTPARFWKQFPHAPKGNTGWVLGCAFGILLTAHGVAQSLTPWDSLQQAPGTSTDCSGPDAAQMPGCATLGQTNGGGSISLSPQRTTSEGLPPGQLPPNTNYTDPSNPHALEEQRLLERPMPLPPEPLTEFQKFVAATTGVVLPIFGDNLFRNVPSTFAPLDLTPVPPGYVIEPGDELRIRVWGQVNFRADLHVDRMGDIYIPQVGGIHVAGLPFSALDHQIRTAVGRIYRNFDLTVDLGQTSAIQVYVTGEARRPGVYTISSLSTLANALFATGGPATNGSMRDIELRRGGKTIATFDLYALLIHGDISKDMPLLTGDVIYIPSVGSRVAILGSVRTPAIYELLPGETMGEALRDAGGASTTAGESRISVERIEDHRSREAFEIAFNPGGLATTLHDGDVVRVLSIVPMYEKTVTLRGNTANPGRYGWHPGMRLSDLIPDRNSLLTRNYWWKRALLGLPAPEFEPAGNLLNLHQPSSPVDLQQQAAERGLSINPGQATTLTPEQMLAEQALAARQQATGASQLGASPQAAAAALNASGSLAAPGQTASMPRAGETEGNSAVAAGMTATGNQNGIMPAPRTEVRQIAPEIDWNYAVIERMDPNTLKSTLIPFDLGRLVLQHDPSQDLELQPGDVVTIFSQNDIRVPVEQQTKYVRLEGEFVHAGVYSVRPGETLRELVERAGGLTPRAYLYGSEFTRESTRALQQQRIDEYVQNLQMQIERGSLALAASPVATAQDLAGGAAAQTSEHELVAQLQRIRATGRIVLDLQAGSRGVDSLPNLPLEDGDRFLVPPIPATVNVVGAVYDQSSFLYASGRRAGDYLRLAGGPGRDADSKHDFVIRADGSVISRNAENGLWGNSFDALLIYPGDTIVVPEKTLKPSALRGFLDWSQLFSQFALGAAAIAVIQ